VPVCITVPAGATSYTETVAVSTVAYYSAPSLRMDVPEHPKLLDEELYSRQL
jgi:hypothetical protein